MFSAITKNSGILVGTKIYLYTEYFSLVLRAYQPRPQSGVAGTPNINGVGRGRPAMSLAQSYST
jgi:hypothetical protein